MASNILVGAGNHTLLDCFTLHGCVVRDGVGFEAGGADLLG